MQGVFSQNYFLEGLSSYLMMKSLIPAYKIPKLITEFIKVFTRPQTRNLLGHSLQFAEMLAGDSVQLHDCMLHISLHPAIFRRPAAVLGPGCCSAAHCLQCPGSQRSADTSPASRHAHGHTTVGLSVFSWYIKKYIFGFSIWVQLDPL